MGRGPWLWTPATSAFTRVFNALCAGVNGRSFAARSLCMSEDGLHCP